MEIFLVFKIFNEQKTYTLAYTTYEHAQGKRQTRNFHPSIHLFVHPTIHLDHLAFCGIHVLTISFTLCVREMFVLLQGKFFEID